MPSQYLDPDLDLRQIGEDQTVTVITAAVTLNPSQTRCIITIPAAVANAYSVTLPPVGSCPGATFDFLGVRAAGYTNGTAAIQDQDDSGIVNYLSDNLTATGDHVRVENIGGWIWRCVIEQTT